MCQMLAVMSDRCPITFREVGNHNLCCNSLEMSGENICQTLLTLSNQGVKFRLSKNQPEGLGQSFHFAFFPEEMLFLRG